MNLEFDPSITAREMRRPAQEEATAIWKAQGVELLWSDCDVDADLHLDVRVLRNRVGRNGWHPEVGRATIDYSGNATEPINIWFDSLASMLEKWLGRHPMLRDREFGRALGRVMAHELGHVLLGPPGYHDAVGLMRPMFLADELLLPYRQSFELADSSASRLRSQIAHFATGRTHRTAQ